MSFAPINKIASPATLLPIDHIDTDQIIPARFLKATNREGFGKNLFAGWRYDEKGNLKPDFILNQDRPKAEILIAGQNFGCGSSREHAAWALYDYGFKVIMAPGFADIFKNNAMNNGIIPVKIPQNYYPRLVTMVGQNPNQIFHINLECELVEVVNSNIAFPIEISRFKRRCLMEGIDLVDYMINQRESILEFENSRN
ncbi:MAG: 3-isopropylmalate dehydratase small subunit [Bacteroidales bacterium]|nr:3-isopropylmalate dehydratase small subunit [Bacteroidales bacterium]